MTAHPPRPMFHHNAGPIEAAPFGGVHPVLDLRALLATLGRQKIWILLPVVVSVAFAIILYPMIPVRYQAGTQLLIDPRGLQVVEKELAPGSQGEASLPVVESQLKVITSERVLRDLIARETLQDDPEFTDPSGVVSTILGGLNKLLGVKDEKREEPALRALRTLQRRIAVRRNERSFIVDIFFEASTPQKAARLADALASAYLESEFTARGDVARRVEQSLSGRLTELRDQVRQAEERVEAYKAANNIVGASGRLINEQQLLELNAQLGTARARTAELKARTDLIERARRSGGDPAAVAEAVQSPTISQMRSQYLDIKRRQSDVLTLLGARHPDVVTLEAQARMARGQIKEELDRIASAASTDYERAQSKEQTLARSLDSQKTDALTTNRAFVRLRELEREAESTRGVYETFLRRTKEVGEQQAVDSANARVISRAVPPREPTSLSFAVLLLGALVLGGGIGILVAWLRDALGKPAPARTARAFRAA